MFKRLRIAVLLYVLLFVAAAEYLAARRSTDWDEPLWVDVYPLAAGPAEREYVAGIAARDFAPLEEFFERERRRYGLPLERPFHFTLQAPLTEPLPELVKNASPLATLGWSLRMRWLAARLRWTSSAPAGDVLVFAVFHEAADSAVLDRSTALRKGLIVVANVFAAAHARGANQMVIAHELLHTLGATDKYDPATNLPRFPDGYADPAAKPVLPQKQAELMAGRIALGERRAAIPESLAGVAIGPATATEIGWLRH